MPKIQGTLADVSTQYVLIDPDTYEMKVEKIDIDEKPASAEMPAGQYTYIITSRVDMPGTDHHNKPVREYISWFKKDGNVNEYSKVNLKRYFEAILGEDEANRDDLDTDELIGGRFLAEIRIETYTRNDGVEGQSNKLKNIVALD